MTLTERYHCESLADVDYSAGVRPPDIYAYPQPSGPSRIVFIGWNPPKPFGGFWSLDTEDNLRSTLHEILFKIGRIEASQPNATFLDEFISNGFFFLHAVKCWTKTKYPGFGRNASKEERDKVGLPLLRACADTHLHTELEQLRPAKVCALGQVPYLGLCHAFRMNKLFTDLVSPTEGKVFETTITGLRWSLLYTCFPQPQTVIVRGGKGRVAAKELTRRHLENFLQ
jgi:hypothetical protein